MDRNILITQHEAPVGPGLVGEFFTGDGWDCRIVDLAKGEKLPETPRDFSGVVILGGSMNVYETEKYPFLLEEERFIRKALIDEIPVLGICLGAQLLAKTCGARVRRGAARELGWHTVKITEEGLGDSLFRGLPGEIKVFQWHEDTFEIPHGASLLAQGNACGNQAFKVGRAAWGTQFHFEVTPAMIGEWVSGAPGTVDGAGILSDTAKVWDEIESVPLSMLLNFRGS